MYCHLSKQSVVADSIRNRGGQSQRLGFFSRENGPGLAKVLVALAVSAGKLTTSSNVTRKYTNETTILLSMDSRRDGDGWDACPDAAWSGEGAGRRRASIRRYRVRGQLGSTFVHGRDGERDDLPTVWQHLVPAAICGYIYELSCSIRAR